MRILIVEDDNVLADGLLRSMRNAGYTADCLTTGDDADNLLHQEIHDLVILDLGLPRMDGFQVLQRLRQRKSGIPVLILTARGSLEDRVKGLDLGADDYLAKPFDLPELTARVRALMRRVYSKNSDELCLGSLCLDIKAQRVTLGGKALGVSAREIAVLETLLRRPGGVVSKGQIVKGFCDWDSDISDNAVEVYVHRLRKKLVGSGIIIRTVRGLGYMLDQPTDPKDE
ncbi:MAG TPA: response regulator [Thermodesulfovibrionales bacterium]|nr:response regulator [Thermodesulfovibrionales bacterium]